MVSVGLSDYDYQPDSAILSLLDARRDRKDARVFAHAAAETQVAIRDSYAAKKQGIPDAVMYGSQDPGFLEVFPRVASRPPKLLQELEAILIDRLRTNDKAASTTAIGSAKDRDPRLSANLSLDAHRQVFSAFISGFTTYCPLLSKIQDEFEHVLDEGVRSAQENVEMRYQMAQNELQRERAAAEVRGGVLAEDLAFRASALDKLQELTERVSRAEKKKVSAEKDLRDAQLEQARMQAVVVQLREANRKLSELTSAESKWAAKPLASSLSSITVGPMTAEDEDFLEQELGTSTASTSRPATYSIGALVQKAPESKPQPTDPPMAEPSRLSMAGSIALGGAGHSLRDLGQDGRQSLPGFG